MCRCVWWVFKTLKMADLKERVSVKFCFLLGKTAAEGVTMLEEVLKDKAVGKTSVCWWFNCFKWAEIFLEDHPHCGHRTMSWTDEKVEEVRQTVVADCRQTIDEISEITDVSWNSCQHFLTEDVMMKWAPAKFVPHLLTEEQKIIMWMFAAICRKSSKMALSFSQNL